MDNDELEDGIDPVEITDEVPDTEPTEEVDWKAKFEEEEGKRRRAETKLSKLKEKPEPTPEPQTKTNDFDYGELAFLTAKGFESEDEVEFLKTLQKNTGRELKDLVNDEYAVAKIKSMRDAKAVQDATPSGTKRSTQSASDTVEYWLAKGELPEDTDLRRKVVNARIEKETRKDIFTP